MIECTPTIDGNVVLDHRLDVFQTRSLAGEGPARGLEGQNFIIGPRELPEVSLQPLKTAEKVRTAPDRLSTERWSHKPTKQRVVTPHISVLHSDGNTHTHTQYPNNGTSPFHVGGRTGHMDM